MNSISKREHILLLTCFVVAAVVGYWLFRFRPLQAEISGKQESGNSATTQIDEFEMPPNPTGNPAELSQQLLQFEELVASMQSQLGKLEGGFADSTNPGSIQQLKVEISELARQRQLQITQSVPFDLKKSDLVSQASGQTRTIGQNLLSSVYKRPTHLMKFDCRFEDLVGFVEGLKSLSRRIVILKLDLAVQTKTEAKTKSKVKGPQLINIEMVLAL